MKNVNHLILTGGVQTMKKRLFCLLIAVLLLATILACPIYAFTNTEDINQATITLYPLDDGTYTTEITQTFSNSNMSFSNSPIKAYAKNDAMQVYIDTQNPAEIYMRINDTRLIPAQEISLGEAQLNDVETVCIENSLSDLLEQDLRKIAQCVKNGEIENCNVNIYLPKSRQLTRGNSKSTYTGYNGRQYYEELLDFSANSESFSVKQPTYGFGTYVNNVIKAAAQTTANNVLDLITGNAWSIASVLLQSAGYDSIPTTAAVKHSAVLIENKYRKYTYIYDGNEMLFGSLLDYTYIYRFQDLINYPGLYVVTGERTPPQSRRTADFYKADEVAYFWYLNSGYKDIVHSYTYTNQTENLTTNVDSMFK